MKLPENPQSVRSVRRTLLTSIWGLHLQDRLQSCDGHPGPDSKGRHRHRRQHRDRIRDDQGAYNPWREGLHGCSNESRATGAIARLKAEGALDGSRKGQVEWLPLALASPATTRLGVDKFLKRESRLDILGQLPRFIADHAGTDLPWCGSQ